MPEKNHLIFSGKILVKWGSALCLYSRWLSINRGQNRYEKRKIINYKNNQFRLKSNFLRYNLHRQYWNLPWQQKLRHTKLHHHIHGHWKNEFHSYVKIKRYVNSTLWESVFVLSKQQDEIRVKIPEKNHLNFSSTL